MSGREARGSVRARRAGFALTGSATRGECNGLHWIYNRGMMTDPVCEK